MMVPEDLRYSEDHQWIRAEGALCRVGITDFAQEALGEVSSVRLPLGDSPIAAGHEMGEIEAFKAMTDLYMPIDATIVETNPKLVDDPVGINRDPYGAGWLCTVRPTNIDDLERLLDAAAYRKLIGTTDG